MNEEMIDLIIWLARQRDSGPHGPYDEVETYQVIINHICKEYGYFQSALPLEVTCPHCNGKQTIGDRICPTCGGAGYDLAPMLNRED